jgi:hypothetical protein
MVIIFCCPKGLQQQDPENNPAWLMSRNCARLRSPDDYDGEGTDRMTGS